MATDKKPHATDKTPHDAPVHEDGRPVKAGKAGRSVESLQEQHAEALRTLATLKAQTPRDAEAVYQQKLAIQALAEKLAQGEAPEETT